MVAGTVGRLTLVEPTSDRTTDHAAVLARAEAELTEVNEALRRLDDGSYGTCEACGEAITEGQLDADPFARRCIACGADPVQVAATSLGAGS